MAFEKVGVRAVVEGMSAFNRGMRQVDAAFKRAGESAKETQKKTESLNKTLRNVGLGMVAAAGAAGAFLFSAVRLAARVETLGVVTKRLGENVGKTAEEIEALEQGIVKQGITLQASRKSIALMIQAQIDLSKGTALAREAQDAAVIANVNSSEAFERLVFVITSGNVRMARTLGLQVSFQDAYKKMAASVGIATTELTQQQKVMARTNAVLEAGKNISGAYASAMETAGKKVLSLDRHLEESKRILGEVWLPIFAEAVDLVTDGLKAWESLDTAHQKSIATTIGVVVAITGLVGAILILIPKVAAAKAAFLGLSVALGTTGAALALATGGITLIVAALVLLFQTYQRGKETAKAVREELQSFEKTLFEGTDTYEEYRKEAERVNKVLAEQEIFGIKLGLAYEFLDEAGFDAAKAQEALATALTASDKKLIRLANAYKALQDPEVQAAKRARKMARAHELATEAAEKFQEQLEQNAEKVQELQGLLDLTVTRSVEDFREEVSDLNKELEDLEAEKLEKFAELDIGGAEDIARARERLSDLQEDLEVLMLRRQEANERAEESDKERSESSIRAEQNRINELREQMSEQQAIIGGAGDAQIAAIAEVEEEFAEREGRIREQIAETTEAFTEQTRRLIFDLATQRFAIGGFTREELKVLNRLAGPEGLGLIDEAGLELLKRVDEVATGIEFSGDQSEKAVDDFIDFAGAIVDAAESGENLLDVLARMPSQVDIEMRIRQTGALTGINRPGVTGQLELVNRILMPPRTGGKQFGGKLRGGQAGVVGERGRELFIPGQTGMVMPNRFVKTMESLFRAAAPVAAAASSAGGGGNISNTEMNLNIETIADPEPIVQDFEMMRALADRRR